MANRILWNTGQSIALAVNWVIQGPYSYKFLTKAGDALCVNADFFCRVDYAVMVIEEDVNLTEAHLDAGEALEASETYYVYICHPLDATLSPVFRLSKNATYPAGGWDADNSRKIGGFDTDGAATIDADTIWDLRTEEISEIGAIEDTVIGEVTPAAGYFTSLFASADPTVDGGVGNRAYNDARYLLEENNLSDLVNATTARGNLGLGNMATQGAGAVAITGGSIAGADVTVGAGKTLDVSAGTLTLANDQIAGAKVAAATAETEGVVELATTAEAEEGTDTARAVTPAGVAAAIAAGGAGGSALTITTANGAVYQIKSVSEAVTVSVGNGAAGVNTSGNLAPKGTLLGCVFRVTQAPGGGATTLDIGITGGDADGLISGASCDVLDETGDSDTYGTIPYSPKVRTATTLTLTTDANVTDTDMIVRVTVFYAELTAPTS